MPFGTVISSMTIPLNSGTSGAANTNGRHTVVMTTAVTGSYFLLGGSSRNIDRNASTSLLYLAPHQHRGHRNTYFQDALGSTIKTQRSGNIGGATANIRSMATVNILTNVQGRRAYLNGSTQFDLLAVATIRAADLTGLTTILTYAVTDRYIYALHNTNKIAKIDRRSRRIVAEATAPVNLAASDGIFSDDRNIVLITATNDTVYWMRAA